MKRLSLFFALLLSCAPVLAQSCPASSLPYTDSFSGSGALSACWTAVTGIAGSSAAIVSSGTVVPSGGGAYGVEMFTGLGLSASAPQSIQAAITWTSGAYPAITLDQDATGRAIALEPYASPGQIVLLVANSGASPGGGLCNFTSAISSGDVFKLSKDPTTNTYTARDVTTSTDLCSVVSTAASGVPGVQADSRTGSSSIGAVTITGTVTASAPVITPTPQRYVSPQTISMSCATPSSTMYYTLDGSTPTTGSTVYTAPFTDSTNETVKAICTASGFSDSSVTSSTFQIGSYNWFIRADGGTRYSSNMTSGQCDGLADVAYPGTGTDQHCAFNDFRYMWDDGSGLVGQGAWLMVGGDTTVIHGCHAMSSQPNPSDPHCRLGWDGPYGISAGSQGAWCYGVGSYTCYNPPIPAGTAAQHTKILGACAYGTYTCNPVQGYPYTSNLTQLYGGFSQSWSFNLSGAQYVDIEGIELTTHNGKCTWNGIPSYSYHCSNSQPLDDYAQNGFLTDNTTSHVTLQDVYVHGFNAAGINGPIGGPITATRVLISFNVMAGWNLADTSDTPNAAGSSITASHLMFFANGFYEQYPIVNTAFPAIAGYDDLSGGFGDALSGQDSPMDSLTCDHCLILYNTKDGFIGPHTQVKTLSITNSVSCANMGEQWKFGTDVNATVTFMNNITCGNAYRMTAALPGAAQNFAQSTGLTGSYLSDFGRAGGDMFSIITQAGSSLTFAGNTMLLSSQTGIDFNCGLINSAGSIVSGTGTCGSVPIVWKNNAFIGYIDPNCSACGGLAPGLWYKADSSINYTSSYNAEFGIRNGDTCGVSGILCSDPLFAGEPAQTWPGTEAALDAFNPYVSGSALHPSSSSPLRNAGVAVSGRTTDFFGLTLPSTPDIGAVQFGTSSLVSPFFVNHLKKGAVVFK